MGSIKRRYKLIQLLYLAAKYRGFEYLPDLREYFQVTEYPEAEMLGSTPAEWALEFADIAASKRWYQQCRRPVQPGDILKHNNNLYLYTATTEAAPRHTILDGRPHLAICETTTYESVSQ